MPTRNLPPRATLESVKEDASRLLRDRDSGDPAAPQRLREFLPRLRGASNDAIRSADLKWHELLRTIAREYGYPGWARLKAHLEQGRRSEDLPLHERIEDPAFRTAVALMDEGDEAGLAAHLAACPDLVHMRVRFEGMNYFRNPGLLAFIAGNPIRHERLPANAVAIAELILKAGGGESQGILDATLGLVASGRVARESGLQDALIRLLCGHGADPTKALQPALGHREMAAARALVACGARVGLAASAALGMEEEARRQLGEADPAERHLALVNAAMHGHAAIVRLLLDAGEDPSRYNPEGLHSHSTPLHQAVWYGHEDVARLLVERGARRDLRDTLFRGTPDEWADIAGRPALAAWLRGAATG
ncbi:MAG TPA: ankyrin repeat domain-containing protein [Allosphingosinicella sp.]|nr:ankyrin repeat domain-containing protein [Allosphingosinicella sp.]